VTIIRGLPRELVRALVTMMAAFFATPILYLYLFVVLPVMSPVLAWMLLVVPLLSPLIWLVVRDLLHPEYRISIAVNYSKNENSLVPVENVLKDAFEQSKLSVDDEELSEWSEFSDEKEIDSDAIIDIFSLSYSELSDWSQEDQCVQ
jgi:hypothetical protein